MRLAKCLDPRGAIRVGIVEEEQIGLLPVGGPDLGQLLAAKSPRDAVASFGIVERPRVADVRLLPPIDRQEVWAAGVTYKRSQKARMEESESAATFYDRVYSASRPELFLKATPHRVVGPGEEIRIRGDSQWSVPEPELTLVISPRLEIVGFTIGNDMSARDIEGENPLYLPQAKIHSQCAGLGPVITLADAMPPWEATKIALAISRGRDLCFEGETSLSMMNRTPRELVEWLGRDNQFPEGVFLMTGTGIVPPDDFSLAAGDVVSISIDGIGTLTNTVVRG